MHGNVSDVCNVHTMSLFARLTRYDAVVIVDDLVIREFVLNSSDIHQDRIFERRIVTRHTYRAK